MDKISDEKGLIEWVLSWEKYLKRGRMGCYFSSNHSRLHYMLGNNEPYTDRIYREGTQSPDGTTKFVGICRSSSSAQEKSDLGPLKLSSPVVTPASISETASNVKTRNHSSPSPSTQVLHDGSVFLLHVDHHTPSMAPSWPRGSHTAVRSLTWGPLVYSHGQIRGFIHPWSDSDGWYCGNYQQENAAWLESKCKLRLVFILNIGFYF